MNFNELDKYVQTILSHNSWDSSLPQILNDISSVLSSNIEKKSLFQPLSAATSHCVSPHTVCLLNTLFETIFALKIKDESLYYEVYKLHNYIYSILTKDGIEPSILTQPYDSTRVLQYNKQGNVTLFTTTCKRYDLFRRMVTSVLYYIRDISTHVYDWIVVDDNSDEEMRCKMREEFPFLHIIYKNESQKGHPKSMNMIFDIVQTPYVFNIEDDWEFFFSDDYITKMLYVLNHSDQKLGQVLVNLNYAEDTTHYSSVKGATSYIINQIPYWVHNHYTGEELHHQNQKLGCSNSLYWPHFSLRVGITRMDVLREIGSFNEKANHFEMEYANRYTSSGYKTAFLNGVFCLHIGRRTYERHTEKSNAYELNNENQFGESFKTTRAPKQVEILTFVINLKRRVDRLQTFVSTNEGKISSFDVVEGFDGKNGQTSHKIMKAFKSGDYDYRSGIVGCAISHVSVWKKFLQDRTTEYAIILEDDVDICPHFQDKIVYLIQRYQDQFDVIMLHQNPWQKWHFDFQLGIPKAESLTVEQAFKQNMGSAAAYIVSRKGATQLLQHVSEKGMYNAVDWVIMKSGAIQRVLYSVPQLVKANCFQTGKADTDIQTEYTKLKWSDDEWDRHEIEYIHNMLITSVYYNESKVKQVTLTVRGDNIVEKELSILFDSWIPKEKFTFSKTEGLISIIYTHTLLWTRLVDYVFIIPINRVKTEDYQQLNRYAVKWYTTNRYVYIIPDKYVTPKVLQDKVFGNKYLNLVQPF